MRRMVRAQPLLSMEGSINVDAKIASKVLATSSPCARTKKGFI